MWVMWFEKLYVFVVLQMTWPSDVVWFDSEAVCVCCVTDDMVQVMWFEKLYVFVVLQMTWPR